MSVCLSPVSWEHAPDDCHGDQREYPDASDAFGTRDTADTADTADTEEARTKQEKDDPEW